MIYRLWVRKISICSFQNTNPFVSSKFVDNISVSVLICCIFSSWFVPGYDTEKVNNYEVRSVVSNNDISLMILNVQFKGATIWKGKWIRFSMVGCDYILHCLLTCPVRGLETGATKWVFLLKYYMFSFHSLHFVKGCVDCWWRKDKLCVIRV